MSTACTVKYLEPNENLFNILDDWMEKYNTSPKRLDNQQGMFSLSMELTDASQTVRENFLASLRVWAQSNGAIVIATGAFIVVYAFSSLLSKSSVLSFENSQVKVSPFSNVDYFQNFDILSDITPGVYYLDGFESEKSIVRSAINDIIGEYQFARNIDEQSLLIEESEELSKQSVETAEESIEETQIETKARSLESDESSYELATIDSNVEILDALTSGSGVEVYIPSNVAQTGLCRNNTPYTSFYGRWSQGTTQRVISEQWSDAGMPSSNGIATLNGRYLVAVSTKFGRVGDNIDIVLVDGQVIPATIADAKGSDATSEWGHVFSGAVDIIEWEASGDKSDIDLGDWENVKVLKIINYGSGVTATQSSINGRVSEIEVARTEEQIKPKAYTLTKSICS